MNLLETIPINIYKFSNNGMIISAIRRELDINSHSLISSQYFVPGNLRTTICEDKLDLNSDRLLADINSRRTIIYKLQSTGKSKVNLPVMICCQNCDTNFPTKYQYQRHQCEFNAKKVVLKSDVDSKEPENTLQVKYICQICNKQFVNRNNLERHQSCHENMREFICKHCNKQFVSENRLKTHKENHCKKAGDISKFYRSDVTVWKCKKCHEVFSSQFTVNHHISSCDEMIPSNFEDSNELKHLTVEMPDSSAEKQSILIEKVLTEILLQCEFCNRTYADKRLLLLHQKKHTTAKNYECVNCLKVFDSYASAAQHWLKKCTEYVNLFYLPKLTYCEYCDRTFKSHELLYTHKVKKKHYTVKFHVPKENQGATADSKKLTGNNKEVLNMLIEDVLKTLDVPVNIMDNNALSTNNETIQENIVPENQQIESEGITSANPSYIWKKKRGRKRKWPKTDNVSVKTVCADNGFKYQCERCTNVFGSISDLESHREREHASSFTCDECGAVSTYIY